MKSNRKIRKPLPIEQVEVSHKHLGLRTVFFVIFVLLAILGISFGVYYLVRTESGWQTITPRSTALTNNSSEFSFFYYFNGKATANAAEKRAVQSKYTELCVTSYQQFTPYEEYENNVYFINRHYNQEIKVSELLYNSFKTMEGTRFLYLSPIQYYYDTLCSAEGDWIAEDYDPSKNPEVLAFFNEVSAYIMDPEHINVECLADNTIRLNISQEYLAYAQNKGIETFIDFDHYKNAFIVDYLANELVKANIVNGFISSYDGYSRSLSRNKYSFELYNQVGDSIYYSGVASYEGKAASINLRSFMTNSLDETLHYNYQNGDVAHVYFDTTDMMSKCSTHYLNVYSSDLSCADMLKYVYPLWTADSLDETAVSALPLKNMNYIYTKGDTVYYSDGDLAFTFEEYPEIEFKAVRNK